VAEQNDIEWVAVRTLKSREQAVMLGELLTKQGIPTSVEGAMSAGVLPGVEDVRVMVPKERLAEARTAAEAFSD
jgi:hypothetical protein